MTMNEAYDVKLARQAQSAYVKTKRLPHFAPADGVCWSCHDNIYWPISSKNKRTGITVEEAGSRLITGCPHCHHSYCD